MAWWRWWWWCCCRLVLAVGAKRQGYIAGRGCGAASWGAEQGCKVTLRLLFAGTQPPLPCPAAAGGQRHCRAPRPRPRLTRPAQGAIWEGGLPCLPACLQGRRALVLPIGALLYFGQSIARQRAECFAAYRTCRVLPSSLPALPALLSPTPHPPPQASIVGEHPGSQGAQQGGGHHR